MAGSDHLESGGAEYGGAGDVEGVREEDQVGERGAIDQQPEPEEQLDRAVCT